MALIRVKRASVRKLKSFLLYVFDSSTLSIFGDPTEALIEEQSQGCLGPEGFKGKQIKKERNSETLEQRYFINNHYWNQAETKQATPANKCFSLGFCIYISSSSPVPLTPSYSMGFLLTY